MLLLAAVRARDAGDLPARLGGGLPKPDRRGVNFPGDIEHLSVAVAVVLLVTYVAGLFFSLKTHRDLFNPEHDGEDEEGEPWTVRKAVTMLAIAGVAVGVMSEILVGSIEEASEAIGLSPFFVGDHRRRDRRQRRRALGRGLLRARATRWTCRSTSRSARAPRSRCSSRRCSCSSRSFVGPYPDGAGVQRARARGDLPGGPDRPGGHARGRVDLVRGPPAARGLRRARAAPSSSSLMLRSWAALAAITVFLLLGRPALLRAAAASRPSARAWCWSIGWLVVSLLAGAVAAAARHARARRLRHLHDRLLRRALAVARQPVRVRPAVRVLRGADRVPRAAAVLRHRRGARAARRRRSSAASRCSQRAALLHLRARRAAAHARLPDPARGGGERRPRPQLHRAAGAAGVPGHERLRGQAAVRAPRRARAS